MVDISHRLTTLTSTPVRIFDLACGTGAVEAEIYAAVQREQWGDLNVLAGDISQPMLDYLSSRGKEEGWSGLETRLVDGNKLDELDGSEAFAHVYVGFAMYVFPGETLGKLAHLVQHGGTLAVSTWAYLLWYGLLERTYERMESALELPTQAQLWAGMTNGLPWHDKEFVREQLEGAGLQMVEVVQTKINVDCGTPEVFMATMELVLGMLSKQWPEEKREGLLKEVRQTMNGIVLEEVGGEGKHVFLEAEGIVGVGLKGQ